MRPYASQNDADRLTIKDLWFYAYIAALHRVEPIAARMIADEAVQVAHERWKNAPAMKCWDYLHNYPVGADIGNSQDTPEQA
ncbi:hypothetical protein [Paraburkholderia sp. BCC1885]|uniref:hypothetical protein n=1 Tax=Paraburkholderia sp. BCC1885 TaxID=2562669 RepID=UPI0011821431|nr:hypothetical protein [Paraburkholderia sp. BCC1885]